MNESDAMRRALEVARRQWWIVAVVVAVALVAGFALTRTESATWGGQVTVLVDTPSVARYKGVPSVDDMVSAAQEGSFTQRVAGAAGVSESAAGKVRYTPLGNPPTRVQIAYTSADRADAMRVVKAAASSVVDYVHARSALDLKNLQDSVDAAKGAIAVIEQSAARTKLDAWQTGDNAFKIWTIRQQMLVSSGDLDTLATVYSVVGAPSVTEHKGSSRLASNLAGALLVGLVAGLALAALREAMLRRRQAGGA